MKWGFPLSINLLFWSVIGLIRYSEEKLQEKNKRKEKIIYFDQKAYRQKIEKVAVCVAAKNEEKKLTSTIKSIVNIVPAKNCFVVSDGSLDKTVELAKKQKCRVLVLKKSVGKAKAIQQLIKKFRLLGKYNFVIFVDADTILDREYLKKAFEIFEDKEVAAIAGYAVSEWVDNKISWGNFFRAYRTRLYFLLQLMLVYGQSWKKTNVTGIIPGFASMYRSRVLKKIRIYQPGLAIEDFNMTIQVRKKGLGKIAHYPEIRAIAQDPTNLNDYVNQVKRWNLGFFQAMKKQGVWPSAFWLSLGMFTLEVFTTAVFFFSLPYILFALIFPFFEQINNPSLFSLISSITSFYELWYILFGVFIIDYFMTLFTAIVFKKPIMLLFGLGFIFLRIIDTVALFVTAPGAFFVHNDGVWLSPARK